MWFSILLDLLFLSIQPIGEGEGGEGGGRGRRRGEWRKGREGQEEATLGVMCRYIDEPTVCLYMG